MNAPILASRVFLILASACFFNSLACCPPIRPTPNEVHTWVRKELPPGTPESDVMRFCEVHAFGYPSIRDPGSTYVQAVRRVGGCESTKPVVMIEIRYDEFHRVKSADVRGGSMLP
jgi:hypothetical protein